MPSLQEWPPRPPDLGRLFEVSDLRDLVWFLKRYWLIAVCSSAVLVAGAAVYLHFFPPLYKSEAAVRFLPPQVAGRFVNPNFSMEVEQRLFALGQLVNSRLTAARLIESNQLYPERRSFQTVSDLVARFRKDLDVVQIGVQEGDKQKQVPTVRISFLYPDPEKARNIVQRLVEQIYEENRKYRGDQSLGTTDFLTEQLAKAEETMVEAEDRLGDVQSRLQPAGQVSRTGELTQKAYAADTRLRDLRHDMRGLEERRAVRAAELTQLEAEARRIESRPADYYRVQSQNHDRRLWLEGKLDGARQAAHLAQERWKPGYQERVAAEQELAEAEKGYELHMTLQTQWLRSKDREVVVGQITRARLEVKALDNEIANQKQEEASIKVELQRLREQNSQPEALEAEFLVAKRAYELAKTRFEDLQKKHAESQAASELERRGQGETMEVLEPPSMPEDQQYPTRWMVFGAAGIFGLLLGFAACLLHALRRPRILRADHVERWTGLQVLASFTATSSVGSASDPVPPKAPKQSWRKRVAVPLILVAALAGSGCAHFLPGAESLWKKGLQAQKEGKSAAAMVFYRQAIRKDARFAPAYRSAAQLALETAQLAVARNFLFRAAELTPNDPAIQEQLGEVTYQIYFSDPGRPMTLLRELESIATTLQSNWPKRPSGYRFAAMVLIERHRGDEAYELLAKAAAELDDNVTLRIQLASLRLRRGDWDGAETDLRGIIADVPRYSQAYDLLYLHLVQARRPADAGELLKLKFRNDADPDAALQLAAHADAHGDRAAAASAIDTYVRFQKGGQLSHLRAGDFWLQRKEYALSRQLIESGAAATNRRAEYIGRLAELELIQGRRQAAQNLIEAELKSRPQEPLLRAYLSAIRLGDLPPQQRKQEQQNLESILQNMPDSPFVRYHLGRAYLLDGGSGQAAEQFEMCIRLDPNYAPGWLALAELEVASGNVASGEQRADQLLRRNPNYSPALVVRARAQLVRGKTADAAATLTRLLEVAPQDKEALYWLAQTRLNQRDFPSAQELFGRGEKVDPADPRWVLGRANAHFHSGNQSAARKVLEAALQSGNNKEPLLAGLGQLQLLDRMPEAALVTFRSLQKQSNTNLEYGLGEAGALGLAGKLDQASALYVSLQKSAPSDSRPWLHHAALLAENNRKPEAIAAYRQALARQGNNPFILNNLAWLLLETGGDKTEALEYAQQARRLMGQSREIDDTLASAYVKSGMYRSALAVYQEMETYLPPAEKKQVAGLIQSVRKKADSEKQPGGA